MVKIELFTMAYYQDAYQFWQQSDGIGLSDADSFDNIRNYLVRNPGMCFIALAEGILVGTILAGHDGRRGYIHHLAVQKNFRRRGIGKMLVDRSIEVLAKNGINKCHLFIFNTNTNGISFWQRRKWLLRSDISIMSKSINMQS